MIVKNKFIPFLVNTFIYLGVFVSSLYIPTDPDLGWHLKYGEYFFKTGHIVWDNPFSQLMPNYNWHNSSWLTDLISYQTFHNFGFIGLSVLGAIVVSLTFFFLNKAAKLSLFEKCLIFPIILYFASPVNDVSFRGQLMSLLLMAVMYFVLSKYEENKKTILTLIPIFMVWGNLHGEYILGLGILAIWTFIYLVKEVYLNYKFRIKKLIIDNKFLLVSVIGSGLAVMVNPFGIGVYDEALGHFSDPLQKSVTEFLAPVDFSAVWWHLFFSGFILLFGIMLLGTGRRNLNKAPFYAPSLILYAFTFWIRRYAWPFYYSAIFLFQSVAHFFEPENKKHALYSSFIIASLFLASSIYLKQPFTQFTHMNWDVFCTGNTNCSKEAAQAVINNKLNNNRLLTIYDYGGFLIWNYPEIKPTIDGRMHLWRDEKDYSAFEYYYPIEQNTSNDIAVAPYDAVLTSKSKPIYSRLIELKNQGKWTLVYDDNRAAVFKRNK